MSPAPLVIYAVSTYQRGFDIRYVMARVVPPGRSYEISVPPGIYDVVARLDGDPLSAAGHMTCPNSDLCGPVMTRAGYVACQTAACQPVLTLVNVDPGAAVTGVDVGFWGSIVAQDKLWNLDEFGAPGPITYSRPTPGVTPSAVPQLPYRQLPLASSAALPLEFGLPYEYDPNKVVGRLHLPAGWSEVRNPAQAVETAITRDYSSEAVRSSLSLDGEGIWLTVYVNYFSCPGSGTPDATSRAVLSTLPGPPIFYFEDPHSPVGEQPFSGYAFMGTTSWGKYGCLTFRFTTRTDAAREANLPTFLAIVQQSEFVG